jgi:alanyl-tRNA synthetase
LFSAPLDQAPALVRSQAEAAKSVERARQKIEAELAAWKGRELYQNTPADAQGRRVHQQREPRGAVESWRALAQQFAAAGPGAVFLLAIGEPPALLLALSADLPLHAGDVIKTVAQALGGRGGGNAQIAQASLPQASAAKAALDQILEKLRQ